jgi:hypothetical protein
LVRGARGLVEIIRSFGKLDFAIEPYFRYWLIQQSDYDVDIVGTLGFYAEDFLILVGSPGFEPKNSTMEWGIRAGIRF